MKIAFLGDIGQFGKFCIHNEQGLENYFKEVSEYLACFDIVIGNLETPYVDKQKPVGAKSAHILARAENVEILKYLNVNYVNLSNNHIFDYGESAYFYTKSILEKNNIKIFGTEGKEQLLNVNGIKVALNGYCSFNTNPLKIVFDSNVGVNGLDVDHVIEKMKVNHENGYFNVISVHSGQEHVNIPSKDDIIMARKFSTVAPYIYYGHHPHVVQGVEMHNKSLIAYSLGNFCFSDVYTEKSRDPLVKMSENNKTGLILTAEIDSEGIVKHGTIPIYMATEKMTFCQEIVKTSLDKYNAYLSSDLDDLEEKRTKLISEYVLERKKLRNLNWYIKRSNLSTIKQILDSKINANKYVEHVKSKL